MTPHSCASADWSSWHVPARQTQSHQLLESCEALLSCTTCTPKTGTTGQRILKKNKLAAFHIVNCARGVRVGEQLHPCRACLRGACRWAEVRRADRPACFDLAVYDGHALLWDCFDPMDSQDLRRIKALGVLERQWRRVRGKETRPVESAILIAKLLLCIVTLSTTQEVPHSHTNGIY